MRNGEEKGDPKEEEEDMPIVVVEKENNSLLRNGYDETDALPSNLRYNNFDLICSLISILTYLFDLIMDCVVAFYFYHLGVSHGIYHYWYCGLTITFILLPSFTMTGFSLRWYLMDADNDGLDDPVPLWRWILRLIVLFLQLSPILRYIDSIRYGLLSRVSARKERQAVNIEDKVRYKKERKKYFTLMVYEDADATLLRLFECFMESAPQLVLQIYILIKDPHANKLNDNEYNTLIKDPFLKTSIFGISIISSLVSLAWSLVVYHRSLRYTFPDKNNINIMGSIFQFLWHFLSITARVLALSLFASLYPRWIGPACAAHWVIMSSWVILQRTETCKTHCEEFLFAIVLGAIYVFSFFNAKEEKTRWKYAVYYTFCFFENSAFILLWFINGSNASPSGWYYYPGIIGHYFSFFGGIIFMMSYYAFFHPNGVQISCLPKFLQRKPIKRFKKKKRSTPTEQKQEMKPVRPKELAFDIERPISRNSRTLSSPELDPNEEALEATLSDPPILPKAKIRLQRSVSAPSKSPYHHYMDARTFKDMRR